MSYKTVYAYFLTSQNVVADPSRLLVGDYSPPLYLIAGDPLNIMNKNIQTYRKGVISIK